MLLRFTRLPDWLPRSRYGNSVLMHAVIEGRDEVLAVLLIAGASVNLQNQEGWTALMWAAVFGRLGCAEQLVAAGTDQGRGRDCQTVACCLDRL